MNKIFILILNILIGYFVLTGNAFGLGFDNGAIGIKAYFMGSAFVGIADDSSAVHYNPAGLAFNEKGVLYAQLYAHYQTLGFTYTTSIAKDKSDEAFLGGGFFLSETYDNWAFGWGTYIPFGGGGYSFDNMQGINGNDMEVMLGIATLHPAVAYKVNDKLSIGAGLIVYVGQWEEEMSGYKNKYDALPAGIGGNMGIMYKPTKELSVGLNVRTKSSIQMDGTETINGVKYDSDIEFTVPYYFDTGLGYRPRPDLLLGVHFVYMLWGETDEFKLTHQGTRVSHFKDSFRTGIGMEYEINEKCSFLSGFKYVEPSVNKQYGLFPGTNEICLYTFNLGLAYKVKESLELDLGGLYTWGSEKDNDIEYEVEHIFITVGARFRF
ncbi:MAG TPA: hypothetical protein DCY35_02030 [Prolixibacteraceae bacterium]|nr:hypothetical protein [Prolixibacteraceae bacterium]